jgi:hypothetical protein
MDPSTRIYVNVSGNVPYFPAYHRPSRCSDIQRHTTSLAMSRSRFLPVPLTAVLRLFHLSGQSFYKPPISKASRRIPLLAKRTHSSQAIGLGRTWPRKSLTPRPPEKQNPESHAAEEQYQDLVLPLLRGVACGGTPHKHIRTSHRPTCALFRLSPALAAYVPENLVEYTQVYI